MEVNPNTQQSNGLSEVPNALGNVQRPGEYLRQNRITQKMDLEKVAKDLNIPIKALTALEQDNYTALPEATFIKGYYRSYAKYLKVDAGSLIQRFDEIYANDTGMTARRNLDSSPIKIMGKLPGSNSERNKKWLKRSVFGLAGIILLSVLIIVAKSWSDDQKTSTVDAMSSDIQILSTESGATTTSGDTLRLSFNRPTSVSIVDSTGKVLATGRQSSNLNLTGESPFQIRLDDASAVSLSLNDEVISLSPYTSNGKAEFRLSR